MSSRCRETDAEVVAKILRAIANRRRLLILLKLAERTECSLNLLAEAAGASRSALSQHLRKMRDAGIVSCRKESQRRWYRIKDPEVGNLISELLKASPPPASG